MKNLTKYMIGLLLLAVTFILWTITPEGGMVSMAALAGIVYNPANKCRRGSIKSLWLAPSAGITSFTLVASKHGYNYITQASPTLGGFKKYTFEPDKAYAKFTAKENENGTPTFDTEIQIYEPKLTPQSILEGANLSDQCGLIAIVEFYDTSTPDSGTLQTTKLVFGYDEVMLGALGMKVMVSGESGEKREDANGMTINLKGNQSEIPYYYDTLSHSPVGDIPLT